MKVVQSFWSGPGAGSITPGTPAIPGSHAGNIPGLAAGWLSPEYHWMSWALSVLQAKKVFGEVHLVTDTPGRKMLIDRMGLPYDTVSTELDDLPAYPAGLWSMAKIYVYSIQQEPYLHLDGDVFLWQQPREELLKAAVIAQNPEKDLAFYRSALEQINQHFTHVPEIFSSVNYTDKSIFSANAGFFGGSDLAFIQDYCQLAFSFIEKNLSTLKFVNPLQLNFIYEQYLLYHYAAAKNINIVYYQDTPVEDPLYKDYVKFQEIPAVPMIHPVGGFKKMAFICHHMARYLRDEYPSWYYRIIDIMVNERITISSKVYYKEGFTPAESQELEELYIEDAAAYRLIRETFSLPEEKLWKKIVERHPATRLENDSIMLIPDILHLDITEYELEEIEKLVLDACDQPAALDRILYDMEKYFDAAEIGANYEAYRGLIGNCIKRLLYANILRVKK